MLQPFHSYISRTQLIQVFFPQWYKNRLRLKFPLSSKQTVENLSKDIKVVADYIPDTEYNHLTIQFDADFTGGNDDGLLKPDGKCVDSMRGEKKNGVSVVVKEVNGNGVNGLQVGA